MFCEKHQFGVNHCKYCDQEYIDGNKKKYEDNKRAKLFAYYKGLGFTDEKARAQAEAEVNVN